MFSGINFFLSRKREIYVYFGKILFDNNKYLLFDYLVFKYFLNLEEIFSSMVYSVGGKVLFYIYILIGYRYVSLSW